MLHRPILSICALGILAVYSAGLPAKPAAAAPAPAASKGAKSIADFTQHMRHLPGLLTLHWDAQAGKLYLEIARLNQDLLYVDSLPYGTGSNDLGLDRGQTSDGRIVRFERFGKKILLVQPNARFRSSATDAAEQTTVEQSFAQSVLAGFEIDAEDPAGAAGSAVVLVDATAFFQRDARDVAGALASRQKDTYKLDPQRSVIAIDASRAFPNNIEVEALLTFATDNPAAESFVRDVTPDPHALTVRERQSFVALPDPGYVPRRFDPRAGYFDSSYRDYSAPLGSPLAQSFIARHRLEKVDPACQSVCEARRPIQYYVDRGAPEPVRTALVEGARWWDEAFQSAGWAPGTFRVDVLPEGADPMDVRYNMIEWVHRFTRGWSYGLPTVDPRTGEIIKGTVTLGSLRGRQDYLIAESLLSPYVSGRKIEATTDPMLQLTLARLRQLSAHETGHTLGLAHNFAASSFAHAPEQTVSVMDYPFPWITLGADGVPDLSHAYGVGIGVWDKVSIDYGYRQFATNADEAGELNRILENSLKSGLYFIGDDDARPIGSAHPRAHLWDNGSDPADELERIMRIRAAALARFGENAIRPGIPLAQLQDTLVPLYLLHRYQAEATIKEIGGLDYRYQLRGDGQKGPQIVGGREQMKALSVVLKTLSAEFLTLPAPLLAVLPPRPPGLDKTRESPPSKTGLAFDPVTTAAGAADLTLRGLFNRERAARLVEYHARDSAVPSLGEVIDATLAATKPPPRSESLAAVVESAIYVRTIEALLALAADPAAASPVRAIVLEKLSVIRSAKSDRSAADAFVALRIDQLQRSTEKFVPAEPIDVPPGMPIGSDED